MADTDRRAGYSDIRMLTEFYKWYVTVIRESPLIVVAGSIVALFAAVGSVYAGVEAIAKFVRFLKARFFENRSLYRKLDKLNTDLDVDFVESVIGKPVIRKRLPEQLIEYEKTKDGDWTEKEYPSGVGSYQERIYLHKKYFLQLIVNEERNIAAYAVTTRNEKFNPKIPLELSWGVNGRTSIANLRLGKMKLSVLEGPRPETARLGSWGQLYYYVEAHYFGNPGFYKHYLFGWSPSGCRGPEELSNVVGQLGIEVDQLPKDPEGAKLRNTLKPNTFAVVAIFQGNEKLLEYFVKAGIGPNYYDIREFD